MNWMDRLFGRSRSPARAGAPSGLNIVDLRSQSAIQAERVAGSKLAEKQEELAQELCRLARECKAYNDDDRAYLRMREIGHQVDAEDGYKTMQLLCYRVGALGGSARTVESAWDGIGEWRG